MSMSHQDAPGATPPTDPFAGDSWDIVARELQAAKAAQAAAWGDVDSVTLGRYLAGESDSAEQRDIESALDELPELRKLTDLVRDVLADLDPIAEPAPAASEIESPRILSFADASKSRAPRRKPQGNTSRRMWAVAAAAALFVALGAGMPGSGLLPTATTDPGGAPVGEAMAFRGDAVMMMAKGSEFPIDAKFAGANNVGGLGGVRGAADAAPAPTTTDDVIRLRLEGTKLAEKGDYVNAEQNLVAAANYCQDRFGEHDRATKSTQYQLAKLYSQGLTPPPTMVRSASPPGGKAGKWPVAAPAAYPQAAVAHEFHKDLYNRPVNVVSRTVTPALAAGVGFAVSTKDRVEMIRAIGKLGPAGASALPTLQVRLVEATDPEEVRALLTTLDGIGPVARATTGILRRRLPAKDDDGRAAVKSGRPLPASQAEAARELLARLEGTQGRVGVADFAGCFSVGTAREANAALRRLADAGGREVRVITSLEPVNKADAPKLRANRLDILVTTATPSPTVVVRHGSDVSAADADALRVVFATAAEKIDYDAALAAGVAALKAPKK